MKLRIVKTEGYRSSLDRKFLYYAIEIQKQFIFWKYWHKPSSLKDYGFNEYNTYSSLIDAEDRSKKILMNYVKYKQTVIKELTEKDVELEVENEQYT